MSTNYFTELTNFFPSIEFELTFVGLELSRERHLQRHEISEKLKGDFFRGSVKEYLVDIGKDKLQKESTIFVSFNPGYGSGYDLLLESWTVDLVTLLDENYPIVFTQANDYSVRYLQPNLF